MKKFFAMALVVLAMSFASCGNKTTTTDETLDANVDSTEVVVDSVSVDTVAVDTIVEDVNVH